MKPRRALTFERNKKFAGFYTISLEVLARSAHQVVHWAVLWSWLWLRVAVFAALLTARHVSPSPLKSLFARASE